MIDTASLPEMLILRHGQTTWNREGRLQGGEDSPLTETGEAQARAMGGLLADLGVTADSHVALCSPKGRTQATAQLALAPLGLAWETHDDLSEITMGDWTGLLREEVDRRWPAPDPHEHFLDFYARAPGAESFDALWARVGRVLAILDRPTVIVTHGMTSRFLRTRAMGWERDRLAELPGGQGVIHRLGRGHHETLAPGRGGS